MGCADIDQISVSQPPAGSAELAAPIRKLWLNKLPWTPRMERRRSVTRRRERGFPSAKSTADQGPVVQRVDSTIQRIAKSVLPILIRWIALSTL